MDGIVQDCHNSIANEMELLQSCAKPLQWFAYALLVNKKMSCFVTFQANATFHHYDTFHVHKILHVARQQHR